ncbi:ATP-binding protein [Bacillus sp. FJAT-27251]|uniref:ATP-binding protein n=1 Tax=Bacillus sp. FJAT-27251 TaxID=1684142 RepID=UPI001E47EDF0|nr:ATP-binding protein [Bacillus sp. FJAT-27251]
MYLIIAFRQKRPHIQIACQPNLETEFSLLGDGIGMTNAELIEAMRIATSDPGSPRANADLGRFGLGLKTAYFSQCTDLTILSKWHRFH